MSLHPILALLQFKPTELEALYAILGTASDEVGRALEEAADDTYSSISGLNKMEVSAYHAELEAQAAVIAKLHQLHQLLNEPAPTPVVARGEIYIEAPSEDCVFRWVDTMETILQRSAEHGVVNISIETIEEAEEA